MGIRYIGSKARVVQSIMEIVGAPDSDSGYFVDAFSGTGVVGSHAADLGWPVRVNDHLRSSMLISAARLISTEEVTFEEFGGYEGAISELRSAPFASGFIWREYSPASAGFGAHERMYFTEANARRIDGIRERLRAWRVQGRVRQIEEWLLLADLIAAASRVANIAGTYGCFLSRWTAPSQQDLDIKARVLRSKQIQFEASDVDVRDVASDLDDVVYLDPPYTKRQYAAYYHIQETIARGDAPEVEGVTGLRPWEDKASDFCYKRKALGALTGLADHVKARRVYVSYSSEGHISLADIEKSLSKFGQVVTYDLAEVDRYRPNDRARQGKKVVKEYLIGLDKQRSQNY